MSYFYENILNWLREKAAECGDKESQIEWLYMVERALGDLIGEIDT